MGAIPQANPAIAPQRGHGSRRWLLPFAVVCFAAALWFWGRNREITRLHEVTQISRDLVAGDSTTREQAAARLGDGFIVSEVTARLQAIVVSAASGLPLMVDVRRGDTSGQSLGNATHTACITQGSQEVLVLRFVHSGHANDIQLIGFVVPTAPGP